MVRFVFSSLTFLFYIFLSFMVQPIYILSKGKLAPLLYIAFGKSMVSSSGSRIKLQGLENIDPKQQYLIVSNHQSLFDIPILYAAIPLNFRLFAKKELGKMPLFNWILAIHEHVLVDRNNKRDAVKALNDAAEIAKKYSFAIFPEGTRSRDGLVSQFKVSGLSIAQNAELPILPVAIKDSINIIQKGMRLNPTEISVAILKPISVDEVKMLDRKQLAKKLEDEIRKFVEN